MRRAVLSAVAALAAIPAVAAVQIGKPAPTFTALDAHGKRVNLADYRGKPVVLEWNNPGCPFVQKHYGSGNMQKTQAAAEREGAVWLTINSGAPGKQGYMTGEQALRFVSQQKAVPTAYLLDPRGVIGRGYDARTTPQMVIIDKAGRIAYSGAIDDRPTADRADLATARNHVLAALAEMKAGKPVSVPETRSYGCSVKYQDS